MIMHVRVALTGLLLFASLPLLAADLPRPATTDNNDSCDIGVYPAATLLLPYFEVDTAGKFDAGSKTLFTVTNTSRYPQIAHVTVWTDWSYPVLGFNLFLTGYDVQGLNLWDVIVRGLVGPCCPSGTSVNTPPGLPVSSITGGGSTPLSNTSNPNFMTSGELNVSNTCANLPGVIPPDLYLAVRTALTTGVGNSPNCGSLQIGSNTGALAKGYITVDVVSYCTTQLPTDRDGTYVAGPTAPILFDNVLLGDYQQIGPAPANSATAGSTFDAQGSPMVHIRAVPEGGLSGAGGAQPVETNLPFTFYDRYTPAGARAADRRQPLPSLWTARYIEGGSGSFQTDLKIWREGLTAGLPDCVGSSRAQLNAAVAFTDMVRFDEHENSYGYSFLCTLGCAVPGLPATSRTSTMSGFYPSRAGTDLGGWLYLNLSSGARESVSFGSVCYPVLSAQRGGFGTCRNGLVGTGGSRTTSQNWVITSMFGAVGANRLSVDFDASALGNGCTPERPAGAVIAPASHPSGMLLCPSNSKPGDCSPATRIPLP